MPEHDDINSLLGVPSGADDDIQKIVDVTPAIAPPVEGDADIKSILQDSDAAGVNLAASRKVNPDTYAEQRKAANEIGVPVSAAEAAPDEVTREAKNQSNAALLNNSPATTRFLDSLDNAKTAHDAVEDLSAIEAASNGISRGLDRISAGASYFFGEQAAQQNADAGRSFGDILRDQIEEGSSLIIGVPGALDLSLAGERWIASRVFDDAAGRAQRSIIESARMNKVIQDTPMSTPAKNFMSGVTEAEGTLNKVVAAASNPRGMLAFAAEVGLEFLPQLILGGLTTFASKSPATGAVVMGVLSGLTERYSSPLEFLQGAGVDLQDPKQVDALLANPELMKAASEYGFTRGVIIGAIDAASGGIAGKALMKNPLANIMLQLPLQAGFGGGGEALAQLATKGEIDVNEVIFEAVGELATTPIEVALVGGRGIAAIRARSRRKIKKMQAEANVEVMDKVREGLDQSPLTERSPEQAAEHVSETWAEQGIYEVYIPIEALQEAAQASEDPAKFYQDLGVEDQIEDAQTFSGDVRILTKNFSQNILQTEAYTQLRDHVRMDEDGLTVAESQEAETDLELDVASEEVLRHTSSVKPDPTVELAEHEMGMQALFNTAGEGGFTQKQYTSYLEALLRAREVGAKRKERTELKRQQKRAEAKYQKRRVQVEQSVRESTASEPSFQALLSIGRDRLDYQETLDALGGDLEALNSLPKANNRRIYSPKGLEGVSPWAHADIHGLEGGDVMLYEWLDNPSFEETVQQRTEAAMEAEHPTLISERQKVEEALEALHTDDYADVLAYELNWMRVAKGMGKLKLSLVKAKARKILGKYKLDEINIRNLEALQKREARKARKAVREGDLETAATAKLNQLVAFQMTKEAYKVRAEVKRGKKFMRKFLLRKKKHPSLPVDFLTAIQDILSGYQLGPQLSDRKRKDLMAWAERKAQEEGIPVQIPERIADAVGKVNYQELTLSQWRNLYNTIKGLHKEGLGVNKLRRAEEEGVIQETVDEVVEGVVVNLKQKKVRAATAVSEKTNVSAIDTLINKMKEAKDRFGIDVSTILLNTDSILRNIDGFKSLGAAYQAIKGGIDRAITEGYGVGGDGKKRVGYSARMKAESERLVKLFEMYSKTEKANMWREVDIPGVSRRLTRLEVLGVLLNLGNDGGIQALIDSKQFTEQELQFILDSVSKRDLEFAQGVWDFNQSFWPEIKETVKLRQNRVAEEVEASPLVHKEYGTFRGGYFPLKYDRDTAILQGEVDAREAMDMMLAGGFTSNHTQDGHTETREASGGRPVKLDPFGIVNHLQQIIYDLEVGDAVYDAFKVLHHRDLKKAFSEAGQVKVWDALDLWLGNTVTGEIRRNNFVERVLRRIRTGTTIAALGYNFSVALLQPLGLLQSSALVGKTNMLKGLFEYAKNPISMSRWVSAQTGFMAQREGTYNKDITDAHRGLSTGKLSRITPGKTAEWVATVAFLPITKMQRFVDNVTWLGAKRQGLKMFNNDDAKSSEHADRMVERTQGSGLFHQRTAFERGTISKAVQNAEFVRNWSLFLNYFAAKQNVFYERTKTTNFKNLFEVVDYATDIFLLFVVESALAAVVKGTWPDDDEEDDERAMTITKAVAWETAKTIAAGFPIARDAAADAEGFNTGGASGSFFGKVSRAGEQIAQGELDANLLKSINSVLGVWFGYPTSQVHKTGQAIYNARQEEETAFLDYVLGPKYKK